MSYIDVTGKTEDEALRKGLEQLGMDRDDVSVSFWSVPRPASWASAPPPPVSVSPMVPRRQTLPPPPR